MTRECVTEKYAPNPQRTALHGQDIPDGDLTPRMRMLADAVRGCASLADFVAVPETMRVSVEISTIWYGMSPTVAEQIVRRGITRARAELDYMEKQLGAYGAAPFMPRPHGVDARSLAAPDRRGIVVNLLNRLRGNREILLTAGDRPVVRAQDGGFILAEDHAV